MTICQICGQGAPCACPEPSPISILRLRILAKRKGVEGWRAMNAVQLFDAVSDRLSFNGT